jgi:cytochrome c553
MKHTILGISVFLSAGLLLAGCSQQQDPTKPSPIKTSATQKAQICTTCHGVDGKSGKVNVPPLGGRTYEELVTAMQRVKESYSPEPTLVHRLSDEEMHDIATYFSSFK